MTIPTPFVGDYPTYFATYINMIGELDVLARMTENARTLPQFFLDLPHEKQNFSYAEGKWTPKELLQHIIDAERVFQYRALRIGRNDATPLPGFEENDYAKNCNASTRTMQSLAEEFKLVRYSTLALINSFDEHVWHQTGTASGHRVSTSAIIHAILGHELHHVKIIKERYLSSSI